MNTQAQVRTLEAGEALQLPGRLAGPAVLAAGEVLVQAPASWLADRVVFAPPVRLVAPALLPTAPGCAVVAAREAKVVFHEAAPLVSVPALLAWARWMRVRLDRWNVARLASMR